jgi:hypothetical protein
MGDPENISAFGVEKKPHKQMRARSAYNFYVQDVRATVQAANPDASFADMSSLVGKQWRGLSEAERAPFDAIAAADRADVAASKPRKTPRGRSAYFCFALDPTVRSATEAENPGASIIDMARILGKKWRAMDASAKAPYAQQAAESAAAAAARHVALLAAEAEAAATK